MASRRPRRPRGGERQILGRGRGTEAAELVGLPPPPPRVKGHDGERPGFPLLSLELQVSSPVTNLPVSRNGAEGRSWRRVGRNTLVEAPSSKRSSQPLSSSLYLENVEHIMRQRRRRRLPLRSRLDASRAQKKFRALHYYIDDKAVIRSPGPTFVASPPPIPQKPPSIHHALSCPLFFSLPSPLARPDQFGGGKTHTREGEALQLAHLVVVAVATWANRSPY